MIRTGLIASILALIAMIAISAYGWVNIPENTMMARHWNLAGEADGFSPRNHVLIGFPLAILAIAALFAMIPAIDPRQENVRRSRGLFLTAWIGTVVVMALLHGVIVVTAVRGVQLQPGWVLYPISILIVVLGNFVAKSRSTWFLGVRTPWSLSSEHAWVMANRTTGWLFVLTGIGAAAAGFLHDAQAGIIVLVAGLIASGVIGVVVSYIAWRNDPERGRTSS